MKRKKQLTQKTFSIHGMHCASCVATIEKALNQTRGVLSASVNFATESALIEFDEQKTNPRALADVVKSIGYHMQVGTSAIYMGHDMDSAQKASEMGSANHKGSTMLRLKVIGMDSPHCAMIVEGAIKKLSGIKNVDVDFSNHRAKVVFESPKMDAARIMRVITDAGYKPIKEEGETENVLEKEKKEQRRELNTLRTKLVVGGILAILVFLGSFPQIFAFVPVWLSNKWMLFLLTTPVQFWVGAQFYGGLKLLAKYHTADMNTLIAVGTLSAYIYSAVAIIAPQLLIVGGKEPKIYFDTAAIIIVLILLGKYFEALMKGRASDAIKKLIGLQPKTARIMRGGEETEVAISEVVVGDLIVVRPGEKVPVDGKITEGESEIDESMVTGESMPVHKKTGDAVIGSTINKFGTFTFQATKVGKNTMLAQIVKMVEEAQGSKAPIQRLADVVASYFVPVVFVIAALTFIVWYIFGPVPAFSFALVNFVAVLIIACPCALGLATPMAIMVSSGNAATRGILVKDAASLETANKIDTIVLDKTGTLTEGKPRLTDIIAFESEKKADILTFAASLEQRSEHPLGEAILQYAASLDQKSSHPLDQAIIKEAKHEKIELYKLENFKAISGKGLTGSVVVGGKKVTVHLGNRSLMADIGLGVASYQKDIEQLEKEGKTAILLAVDKKLKGALAVADVLKEESKRAVGILQKNGIEVWMLTGDNERTAEAIAQEAGIANVMSEVLPDQKSEKVRNLQVKGRIVAMVGDGINDAPALTQANIGIAMGEGTDIAMESANITLMRGDLMLIPEVIKLSRRTMRIIKQNLFWAFFYNSAFIPVAAGVLYPLWGVLLNPIFAAIAMSFSSISVVFNSLRLKKTKV